MKPSSKITSANPSPKKKAAGYVRVSTPNQAKDGESLQTQKDSILRFCKNNNMTLIGIYADEGISGASTENRPQFMKVLEDAKNKKFDCLLVHSLSRFGRNTKETICNHELLESCGIELISMDCQMDTTTLTGKMFRSFLASVAEWERGTIKERMLENRTAKWKRGATFIGKVPYGYTWNREKKLIEINPDEEKIYKYIVSLYVNEGLSDLKIALRLKWEGIKFRNRKYPATQTISYMLKNPAYYGHYVLNKHEYTGDRRTGKLKPASDHVVFNIPGIISKNEWDAIQKKREFNKSKAKRISLSQDYFLRDLLVCDVCGGKIIPYTHSRPRKNNSFLRYYTCYYHRATSKRLEASGRVKCNLPLINAAQIEEEIYSKIMHVLTFGGFWVGNEYAPSQLERLIDSSNCDDQILTLEAAYKKTEADLQRKKLAKKRLASLIEEEEYNQEDFYQMVTEKNNEIFQIESALAEIKGKMETLRETVENKKTFMDFIEDNQEWLQNIQVDLLDLSPSDKKRLVESLLGDKIHIWLGRLEEWESGPEWAVGTFKMSLNAAIFEQLAAEGKIPSLNKNSRNHSG